MVLAKRAKHRKLAVKQQIEEFNQNDVNFEVMAMQTFVKENMIVPDS